MADDPIDARERPEPQEPPTASDQPAGTATVGLGIRDPNADTTIYLADASSALARPSIRGELRAIVERASVGARALVIGARVVPMAVRAAEPRLEEDAPSPAVAPAALELPNEAGDVLGPVQTHVVLGGERLDVWISRLDRIPIGSVVVLVATTADGTPVVGELAVDGRSGARLRFTLPWPDAAPPTGVTIVVRFSDEPR